MYKRNGLHRRTPSPPEPASCLNPVPKKETAPVCGAVSPVVAGPGFEPGPGGYEPPEVPFLHPAVQHKYTATRERLQTSPRAAPRARLLQVPLTRRRISGT